MDETTLWLHVSNVLSAILILLLGKLLAILYTIKIKIDDLHDVHLGPSARYGNGALKWYSSYIPASQGSPEKKE